MLAACTAMSVASAAHSDAPASTMAGMQMSGMHMPGPTTAAATQEAYTGNHAFLVKLRSIPRSIPFEKYFTLELAVYDGHHPARMLKDAHVAVIAGMRHGLAHGFAHGMQSTPRIEATGNLFRVSGLYFHMAGPWTLEVDVARGGQKGTAYLTLPCCGK